MKDFPNEQFIKEFYQSVTSVIQHKAKSQGINLKKLNHAELSKFAFDAVVDHVRQSK
jgi:hypothetical protein